jgi:hypothetical protein
MLCPCGASPIGLLLTSKSLTPVLVHSQRDHLLACSHLAVRKMLCLCTTNWGVHNQLLAKQDIESTKVERHSFMNSLIFVCALNLFGWTHAGLAAILAAEPSAFVHALSWQRCPFLLTGQSKEWLVRWQNNAAAHQISMPKSLATGLHTLLSEGRLLSWYSLAIRIHLLACYYAV